MKDLKTAPRARSVTLTLTTTILATLVAAALAPAAFATGDANQASCPSATESSPGFRTYLPDCRAYELATPPFKAGGVVLESPAAISANGEHVIVGVAGSFAGEDNLWFQENRNPDVAVYELSRTAGEGWQPVALTPPATNYPHSAILATSAVDELGTTLWGLQTTTLDYKENIYLREPSGGFAEVGPGNAPAVAKQELPEPENELTFAGASADLDHLLFSIEAFNPTDFEKAGDHSDLWPGDETRPAAHSLYEYVGTGNVEPVLVGVRNTGAPPWKAGAEHINEGAEQISRCGIQLGSAGEGSTYNAVSEDGATVFFTAEAGSECTRAGEPTINELYARVGGSQTVKISEPTAADCAICETTSGLKSAVFEGASASGEKAFFLTEQELLPGQKGMNLYEYDFDGGLEHEKIELVSKGSTEPDVQGVARISENGEQVYFVAKGKLTDADRVAGRDPEEAEPKEGADNLYVYDTNSGVMTFAATLLNEAEEKALESAEIAETVAVGDRAKEAATKAEYQALGEGASVAEALKRGSEVENEQKEILGGTLGPAGTLADDDSVWAQTDKRPVQATPEGRFLLFPSSADLTAGDTSSVPQLFEYDAESETLTRVSVGQSGGDNSGNVSTFHDAPQIPAQSFNAADRPTEAQVGLALTPGGQSVFFTSAAELAPGATSDQASVFEYESGSVYLISDGKDTSFTVKPGESAVQLYGTAVGTEPEGRDVFFTTADALLPQASEGVISLYDAREDGGFPASALTPGCLGEACAGATGSTVLPGPALSAAQPPGGNLTPPAESKTTTKKTKSTVSGAQKLKHALKQCKKDKSKVKRSSCEKQARKRYSSVRPIASSTKTKSRSAKESVQLTGKGGR